MNTGINEVNNVLHENPTVNFNIIVNLGVNDLLNADKYSAKLNELASGEGAWANANVFFESVGAVKEDKARENGYNVTNNDIAAFNSGIKTSLAQAVAYLDVTSDMLTSNNDLNIGYVTSDGLHYTNATSLKLCQKTIEAIRGTNSTTNIDHSELTTEATSATEEATTEAEDTELVEDDLENALYAYDTITDENYMTQPVLFYGTRYQRNIDNTTTALLQNIISNTSDLNSVSNMDSRYLYLNMFGDIVTDDNLVILPGVANPAIYKASKNYNPYTVAFMNSYPVITNRGLYFQVSAEKDIGKYVLMSQATGEHVSDVALNWCMITSNSDIASTNMLRAKSVSSIFYTNITDENEILTGQRCVFNSVETWAASNLYNYNVVLQTYNPSLDEQLLFPYDYVTDKDFKVASTIVKNAYQFIGYNLDEFSYGNNNSLNDNYLAHNVIMSCEDGIKNPQTYYNDKMSEYKQFLATKTEQWTEQVTKASKGIIDKLSNVTGTLGMESSYEDTILGTVLRIMRENFVLIAILVVLILLVAFLKFHRDLLEVCILSAGTVGFFALMVFIIPIYLPMLYNFLVDKTSSTTAYKVLALQAEENTVNDKSIIEIDSDGNYVYNTSSLTLFKVDIKDLNRFYDNMSVSAEDVTAGKTVILNQEAGIFMEGDSIKINTDILFDTLPITGSYKPSQGSICWQLEANKTVSNNLDYYVPYYYFVDNFIGKINTLARIYDLPRSTTSYANHETYDNYLVYSYVNSGIRFVFLGVNQELLETLKEYGDVFRADPTLIDYEMIQAAIFEDKVLEDTTGVVHNYNNNATFAKNILENEDTFDSKVINIAKDFLSLEAELRRQRILCAEWKDKTENLQNVNAHLTSENNSLIKGFEEMMRNSIKLNKSLKEYERIMSKDVYSKISLSNYPNRPIIVYLKEIEELVHQNALIDTLFEILRLQGRHSVKVLRLFDGASCRRVKALPDNYHIVRNQFLVSEITTNDFIAKVGDYREILDIILSNKTGLDVLILVDSKAQDDVILSGASMYFNLCRNRRNLENYNLVRDNTIVNGIEDDNYLVWGHYDQLPRLLSKEEKFLFLASRPVMRTLYDLFCLMSSRV